MTWVVGITAPEWAPRQAFLVSDTRVTWSDGRYLDCLRKVRKITPTVVGGFAGSVRLGFQALAKLEQVLAPLSARRFPADALVRVPRLLARLFNDAPQDEQRLGLSIILAHASTNPSLSPAASTLVRSYASPGFDPRSALPDETAISIGSGSSTFLDSFRRFPYPFAPGMDVQPGTLTGFDYLGRWVNVVVTQNPDASVSPDFHAIAATAQGCVEPTLFSLRNNSPSPNRMDVCLAPDSFDVGPVTMFGALANDGSFVFQNKSADGRLTTIATLLSRPGQDPLLASGATERPGEYASSVEELKALASPHGLTVGAASAGRALVRPNRAYWPSVFDDC